MVLSATLPVKPSVTTTSTVPSAMSSPSMKPWKRTGAPGPLRRRAAPRTASLPFMSSDPTLSSPTTGWVTPSTVRANTSPSSANCTRFSESHSTFAPRSSITLSLRSVGMKEAIAGRSMTGIILSTNFAIAISAPVLPADTTQPASPGRHRVDRQPHRGTPRAAQRDRWLGVVGDEFVGVMDDGLRRQLGQLVQERADAALDAVEQEFGLREADERDVGAVYHHVRRLFAAHGIERDDHPLAQSRALPAPARVTPSRSVPEPPRARRNGRRRRKGDAAASTRRNSGIRRKRTASARGANAACYGATGRSFSSERPWDDLGKIAPAGLAAVR